MRIKLIISLITALLIMGVVGVTGFLMDDDKWDRTWTTAICSGNQCRDYLVICSGQEVVDMVPISGLVTFDEGWEDPRGKGELC
ncbi:hypothetical protein COU62_04810 [Candidatus Pacearchaeota archaeon CG10_big_fil_rev_8_21_14_0_10_35_219]|nr:hypothetical protein [Candidatus Pacearchaeota archaeon]OIO42887.1 MAG: hypothetical protein AUJ63_01595 [Candidatus Pacearchaeota archaeon CG1_02_35_32]PIO07122.1 MAG: hypothetical protein COU62_04810 [Candidatus Pacearchaeota archaeon CG10_big_fil_rev_8_21_14_0_10_35_219]PIY81665.1 MAG: hypothetical protein COY79_01585 [Candidatus Pacearchaeota archaeon CG_4_10_14_0_8_um_filter_35_169]PJA70409.1 MAG: hypothetical protein CO155_00090 [Candidatus Pacearchaeota archaeon CG_4_9_14_3_um_filter_